MKYSKFLPTGTIEYYLNDSKYLVILPWGNKIHYKDDLFHKEDGYAVEYVNIDGGLYFYKGFCIECSSLEEFKRKIKLLVFI